MADTKSAHFDLVFYSWIPVVTLDAAHREVGLYRLLRDAHRFRRIGGASPPMTAALHRLALSILRRVFGPLDERRWLTLWECDRLPGQPVKGYLAARQQRFDLFHPERPFFQDPLLFDQGEPRQLSALLRAAGQPVPDRRPGEMGAVLTPAEAARWLVTARMCPAVPTEATDTPGYRFVDGLVEGADLRETLLLNLRTWPRNSDSAGVEGRRHPDAATVPQILLKARRERERTEVTGVWVAPQQVPARPDRTSSPARSLHQSLWRWYGELLVGGRRPGPRPGAAVRDEVSTLAVHGWLSASASVTARLLAQGWSPTDPGTTVDLEVPLPVPFLAGPPAPVSPARAAIALAGQVGAALDELRAELRRQAAFELDPGSEHEHWTTLWARTSILMAALARAIVSTAEAKASAVRWVQDLRVETWRIVDTWVESPSAQADELVRLHRALARFDSRFHRHLHRFLADMTPPGGSDDRMGIV